MLCIIDKTTDPYWNLAAEEYLFNNCHEPIFRLWQNRPSVIIGHNQNALAEINYDFVKENNIPVVRRLSGGGAVFHDLGNINFTFIVEVDKNIDTIYIFREYTKPIINALKEIGIEAELNGRNDLTINNLKFSGNALYKSHGRIMMHGTLLFNSSINNLSNALKYRPEKFADKAVKSTRSRVTNISEHLTSPMSVAEFMEHLSKSIAQHFSLYKYSQSDLDDIRSLMESKYKTDDWNFGNSPRYKFSKVVKYPCGLFEVFLNVKKGVITEIDIKGDYFFSLPTKDFCEAMLNCPHNEKEITDRISNLPIGEYFYGLDQNNLIRLFF